MTYYPAESGTISDTPIIEEADYQSWLQKHSSEGGAGDSVEFRLLHMWRKDRPLFDELNALLGNEGLRLAKVIVCSTDRKHAEKNIYFIKFEPLSGVAGAGGRFDFSDLSAGTRRVIAVLVSLLFDKRALMLVEEPEDSIHPGLLRKLIGIIRTYSHRTRFVRATHSPHVIDMLRPEELLLLEAPNGNTKIRGLAPKELKACRQFLENEGALSEFLEVVEE